LSTLAILILTKNEQDNIIGVIENAKQCADEVVIVDSGSTDNTVIMAQELDARVVYRAWEDDFSAQRNFAQTQTTADWILYLDADERLNPELIAGIRKAVETDDRTKQYEMQRKSVAFGKKFSYGVLYPDHVARMFPRDSVTWVNKVHEHPECKLTVTALPGHIEHYTYKDWQHWEGKLCLYTTVWAENAFRQGRQISMGGIFGHAFGGFFKMFILRRGFLDGWMGTYMCFNHFFYEMLKYLKLHEMNRLHQSKKEQ
jgi:glycosyltransferase involved in cell wall biosynthesis